MDFRRFTYNDTGAAGTGGKDIAVPDRREYAIYTLRTVWAQGESSDYTYTASIIPTVQLMHSSDNEKFVSEVIMAEYGTNGVVIADSDPITIVWGEHNPWQTSDINAQFDYAFMPEVVLSSGMFLRVTDAVGTGAIDIIEVSGLFGVRDNKQGLC